MSFDTFNNNLSDLLASENGCEYTDLDDINICKVATETDININVLHLNICSLNKNLTDLTLLLKDLYDKKIIIHVISLCETFLSNENSCLFSIENYTPIHRYHDKNKSGGGVSIFVHDCVQFIKTITSPHNEAFESLTIECKHKATPFTVSEIYRPPNTDQDMYLASLGTLLDSVKPIKCNFICGDFNFDLLKTDMHKPTEHFLSMFLDEGFVPYISKPTRVTHTSSTLIDNIFV